MLNLHTLLQSVWGWSSDFRRSGERNRKGAVELTGSEGEEFERGKKSSPAAPSFTRRRLREGCRAITRSPWGNRHAAPSLRVKMNRAAALEYDLRGREQGSQPGTDYGLREGNRTRSFHGWVLFWFTAGSVPRRQNGRFFRSSLSNVWWRTITNILFTIIKRCIPLIPLSSWKEVCLRSRWAVW